MEGDYRPLLLLRRESWRYSLTAAGVSTAWSVAYWITAKSKGCVFFVLALRPDTKVLPIPSFNCFLPVPLA
jgi:hypothetical protein